MYRKLGFIVILVLFICILASCNSKPQKLTIGMIPIRDEVDMKKDFEPIRNYLEKELEIPIAIIITDSYVDLIKEMKNGSIDIGLYGAFSYVAAESEMELTPLVVQQRNDSGTYYYSYIFTKQDSSINQLEDLKGKSFAFVDTGSTSGFVLPYALLKSRKQDFESYFSQIHYSGSHEQVAMDVLNKRADAGAISSAQLDLLIKNEKINKEDYRIIWKSEQLPLSPFVAKKELDEDVKQNFKDAMLNLHTKLPEAVVKFDSGTIKYVEIENKDYNSIRNIATVLGKEDMYEYFLKGK